MSPKRRKTIYHAQLSEQCENDTDKKCINNIDFHKDFLTLTMGFERLNGTLMLLRVLNTSIFLTRCCRVWCQSVAMLNENRIAG